MIKSDNEDFKIALISGYVNDPEFAKRLLLNLSRQTIKNFDFYLFATPSASYLLDDDYFLQFEFKCYHIKLKENRGFSGNNNFAIELALANYAYKYISLVNDDTLPEPLWLEEMLKTAELSDNTGAVASKMIFYEPFVTLTGSVETGYISDERHLGVRFYENSGFNGTFYPKRFYNSGFFQHEEDEINSFRWTKDKFSVEIPVHEHSDENYLLRLFIRKNGEVINQRLKLRLGNMPIGELVIDENTFMYELKVKTGDIKNNLHYIIQNAGSGITHGYSGFDVGSGEIDTGQYDLLREVDMFCGGSCLLRTSALKKVGLFREGYFSYYEDSDLSVRIRSADYKIIYCPSSVIRHYHTGSSKEWSPFFTYHAFRNKIIFASKNFGFKAFLFSFNERAREGVFFLKAYILSKGNDKQSKSRFALNCVILKDSVIGIFKFKPQRLKP